MYNESDIKTAWEGYGRPASIVSLAVLAFILLFGQSMRHSAAIANDLECYCDGHVMVGGVQGGIRTQ
jgi:hypothetical protein